MNFKVGILNLSYLNIQNKTLIIPHPGFYIVFPKLTFYLKLRKCSHNEQSINLRIIRTLRTFFFQILRTFFLMIQTSSNYRVLQLDFASAWCTCDTELLSAIKHHSFLFLGCNFIIRNPIASQHRKHHYRGHITNIIQNSILMKSEFFKTCTNIAGKSDIFCRLLK